MQMHALPQLSCSRGGVCGEWRMGSDEPNWPLEAVSTTGTRGSRAATPGCSVCSVVRWCRSEGNWFAHIVPDRTGETLSQSITTHVRPGSFIWSDMWAACYSSSACLHGFAVHLQLRRGDGNEAAVMVVPMHAGHCAGSKGKVPDSYLVVFVYDGGTDVSVHLAGIGVVDFMRGCINFALVCVAEVACGDCLHRTCRCKRQDGDEEEKERESIGWFHDGFVVEHILCGKKCRKKDTWRRRIRLPKRLHAAGGMQLRTYVTYSTVGYVRRVRREPGLLCPDFSFLAGPKTSCTHCR